MCGFAGFLDLTRGQPAGALTRSVAAMTATLDRRGPDDSGEWVDEGGGVALGHRRLAVIDLSDAGAQPMESADGRFVIAYNGEIYNAREIAARLAAEPSARPLRGHCDTEVLLEAAARWGVTAAVESAVGMFAFALWDKRERRLTLARDRLGIKPLYWGRMGRVVLFGGDGGALQRGQQHPPERIAERQAKTAFERLYHDRRVAVRVGGRLDLETLGFNQVSPVLLNHGRDLAIDARTNVRAGFQFFRGPKFWASTGRPMCASGAPPCPPEG